MIGRTLFGLTPFGRTMFGRTPFGRTPFRRTMFGRTMFGLALIAATAGCRQLDVVGRGIVSCDEGTVCPDGGISDAGAECPPHVVLLGADGRAADPTAGVGRALCACGELSLGATMRIDAFDSTLGPYTSGLGGGSVAINQGLNANADLRIEGDLTVAEAVQGSSGPVVVDGSLRVGGPVALDGPLTVGGNALVGGDIRADQLEVGGQLTQPANAALAVSGAVAVADQIRAPVTVEPPCGCDALPEVSAAIADGQARASNDPETLVSVSGPRTERLACGAYAFRRIGGDGDLTLLLSGPTVIFVTGDVAVRSLEVRLEAGASLDMFVGGGWVTRAALWFGAPDRPSASRLYVGTSGTINLEGGGQISARLWAPEAEIVTADSLEVFGSLFVRRISGAGPVTVHYDRAAAF